jgi:Flp pilus assembly protein TadD
LSRSKKTPAGAPDELQSSLLAHPAFICALLGVVTFALFWPVRSFDFISLDDSDYVTGNPHVKAGLTWEGVVWAFGIGRVHNWHPLTWLSHMLDAQLFGTGAAAPHVINVLFHIANSILLFLLLRSATGAHWRSAFVAALFAWHPLHVESIAWISERKDVLSTLFWLLTLWAYSRIQKSDIGGPRLVFASGYYWMALLFFVLGLMAKPMLVTLPFVMLLWDVWPLGRWKFEVQRPRFNVLARLLVEKTPFFALSAASCVITVLSQKKAIQNFTYFPLETRIENAFVSYVRYLGKMFWPSDLTLPYPPHPGHWPMALTVFSVALVLGLCAAALWLGRKQPFVLTGWFWFLGTLVPVIGLVQVGIQSLADRYTYVPLIGAFIVLVWGVAFFTMGMDLPKFAAGTVSVAVLVACAARTHGQLTYWRNSETVFGHAIAVNPRDPLAQYSLGFHLFEKGRLLEAIAHYRIALELNPLSVELLSDLGAALDQVGDTTEAIEKLTQALRIAPDHALTHYRLANALDKVGQRNEAIEQYRLAVQHQPDFIEARNNFAVALFRASKVEEAIVQFREAVRFQPTNANAHFNLARALTGTGRRDEAVTNLLETLRLQPDFTPARQLLQSLSAER